MTPRKTKKVRNVQFHGLRTKVTEWMNTVTQWMNTVTQWTNTVTEWMNTVTQCIKIVTEWINTVTQWMNIVCIVSVAAVCVRLGHGLSGMMMIVEHERYTDARGPSSLCPTGTLRYVPSSLGWT